MKNLFIILSLIFAISSIHSQQFSTLKGLEDDQENTTLLYSFGIDASGRYSSVFKFNVNTGFESKIMDAYSLDIDTLVVNAKSISDYEFFPNDMNNFINVGLTINPNILGYAARNDTINYNQWALFMVDISKQNPNKVFVTDFYNIYRSFDGGYTYPVDSTIAFQFLSLAAFDDNVLFGTDAQGNLIKSNNLGITSTIVDTSNISTSLPGLNFYYDRNPNIIYRQNVSDGVLVLSVSTNYGNAFSWLKIYESENPFYITIDSTQSGLIYLADGKQILKSINAGIDFSYYKTLPNKLVGIYKKPDSEILYAASKYQIYEVGPDTVEVIKSVPVPTRLFEYYPLNVGNRWIFNFASISYWPFPIFTYDTFSRTVVDYVIKENNKSYFKIDEKFLSSNYISSIYERIDSSSGKILRYNAECPDSEQVVDDLSGDVGDSLQVNRFENCQNYIQTVFESVEVYNEFGINSSKRKYNYNGLLFVDYSLARGVGLEHILTGYDFGTDVYDLKGFIIDGVVYGDTTLTNLDENPDQMPTKFELSQNYPNPFNPSTSIQYAVSNRQFVSLKIYDILGKEIATLVNEEKPAGNYKIEFNASSLSSGVYFYTLRAGSFVQTNKMILLR